MTQVVYPYGRADNDIKNRWLRVTIKSNEDTGLFNDEISYAGHLLGETTGAWTEIIVGGLIFEQAVTSKQCLPKYRRTADFSCTPDHPTKVRIYTLGTLSQGRIRS